MGDCPKKHSVLRNVSIQATGLKQKNKSVDSPHELSFLESEVRKLRGPKIVILGLKLTKGARLLISAMFFMVCSPPLLPYHPSKPKCDDSSQAL